MKKLAILLTLISVFTVASKAQSFIYHGPDYDIELVSVDANYANLRAVITLKIKTKTDINEVTFGSTYSAGYNYVEHKIAAWDNEGTVFTTPNETQYCKVSQGIYVKNVLDQLPLYLYTEPKVLNKLRLGEDIVFHNVPVNWHSYFNPMEIAIYAEEFWGAKPQTKIKTIDPKSCDDYFYRKYAVDSAYVIAAVGNRQNHQVAIISQVKIHEPAQDFGSEYGYIYLDGEVQSENGLCEHQMDPLKRVQVKPGQWTPILTSYVLPTCVDTLYNVTIYTLNYEENIGEKYYLYACNVPIQWVDVPVEQVDPKDLVKMVGKNCVGQLKLGTALNDIPDRIKGMYNDVHIEDTYYNGRSRKRVSFMSDGIEVMYGISDWSGNNSKLDLLVIDDGVNITEIKYQK